ncbi:MAG: sigma-54 dependent transcriptional regulator [Desulfomonilaceae bacterium]
MTRPGDRILIVDDEKDICDILFRLLQKEGYTPLVAHDGEAALEMIRLGMPKAVVSDVMMPGIGGMQLLRETKQFDPTLPVLMITGYGGIEGAVEAIKEGAYDYLAKPLNIVELLDKLKHALEGRRTSLKKSDASDISHGAVISRVREMMGPSDAVLRICSDVALVAPSNFSVVIYGETGTGKELVARAIHKASSRSEAHITPVDCGAIPETLFESELFGYEKGAFTGAGSGSPGKFELADHGTLFLDEIANMPLSSQIKLLRAIQERSFFRVGGRKPVTVDLRLLVATNQDLNTAVSTGSFSRDLFYRLSEFTIDIPPIRERKDDIVHLADRFLKATNVELAKNVRKFSQSAIDVLLNYHWPGNVRQIMTVVRRAVLQAEEVITPDHLVLGEAPAGGAPRVESPAKEFKWGGLPLKEAVRRSTTEVEKACLMQAIRKSGGNKAKAARLLQIDRKTLHTKLHQYGLDTNDEDQDNP